MSAIVRPPVQGPEGEEGPQGPAGAAGVDGRSIYSASGTPSPTLGAVGDLYIDVATGDLYERTS